MNGRSSRRHSRRRCRFGLCGVVPSSEVVHDAIQGGRAEAVAIQCACVADVATTTDTTAAAAAGAAQLVLHGTQVYDFIGVDAVDRPGVV